MIDICRHAAAKPWIFMPFDVKSDQDTEHGNLLWCPRCNRGFVDNLPNDEAIAAHYVLPKYYTQGASHIPHIIPSLLDRALLKLAWLFDYGVQLDAATLRAHASSPGAALDIGCGAGNFLGVLSELGWDSVGIEPDAAARSGAQERGLNVLDGTAEHLPAELEGRRFKVVLMMHVLEHCRRPEFALQTVRRLLAGDGVFYCEVPNCGSLYFQKYAQISEMLDVPRHLHFFTKASLQDLCEAVGLDVIGWQYHGFARHYSQNWRSWENSIGRRLEARSPELAIPRRNITGSLKLLLRSIGAPPELKYDCIGFFARRRA